MKNIKFPIAPALFLLVTLFFVSCYSVFAETGLLAETTISIDSSDVQAIIRTGMDMATANNKQLIPFMPNSITATLMTIIAGAVFRFFEKRKLEKRIREEKKKLS